jgi:hypothetical protein
MKEPKKHGEPSAVQQGIGMMSGWVGFGAKKPTTQGGKGEVAQEVPAATDPNPPAPVRPSAVRQGLSRMGTWAGVKPTEHDEEDDRQIRFMIGGAGRRLTKEDFLKELQSLDPKARCEIIKESDAPEEMKELARKDASKDVPGSSRLYGAKDAILVTRTSAAGTPPKRRGESPDAEDSDNEQSRPRTTRGRSKPEVSKATPAKSRNVSSSPSDDDDLVESAAERRRREQALRGVEDDDEDISPGRGRSLEVETADERAGVEESAAERRRREAALGGPAQDDSDDDDTPRVPPPVAKPSRGIRFAQSPVRGRN